MTGFYASPKMATWQIILHMNCEDCWLNGRSPQNPLNTGGEMCACVDEGDKFKP